MFNGYERESVVIYIGTYAIYPTALDYLHACLLYVVANPHVLSWRLRRLSMYRGTFFILSFFFFFLFYLFVKPEVQYSRWLVEKSFHLLLRSILIPQESAERKENISYWINFCFVFFQFEKILKNFQMVTNYFVRLDGNFYCILLFVGYFVIFILCIDE